MLYDQEKPQVNQIMIAKPWFKPCIVKEEKANGYYVVLGLGPNR